MRPAGKKGVAIDERIPYRVGYLIQELDIRISPSGRQVRRLEPCHLLGGRRTGWSRRQRISPDQSIQLRVAKGNHVSLGLTTSLLTGDHDPS